MTDQEKTERRAKYVKREILAVRIALICYVLWLVLNLLIKSWFIKDVLFWIPIIAFGFGVYYRICHDNTDTLT